MIVSNYIYFANDILQTQIYYYDQAENSSNVPLPSYIVEPGKAVDAGIVIGGDLYAVEDREAEAATASDEDASVDTQTPPVLTTHSAINSDNPELNSANDENNSRSGLSTGAIVGIAIGVSVLVIILLVFVVRWVLIATKKQREEKYWDNEMENMKSAMSLGQHGQAEPA
ncbi:hypothetical protein GGH12_004561 [Coemansia sp. RSA 1822]|nr:hypothetical protein IW147_003986 [Coemansia sp. RSA 720]KAJ2560736.1 hypothetical protein GGH12_004561 [Coemansia sp. RSA 1822]